MLFCVRVCVGVCLCVCVCLFRKTKNKQAFEITILSLCLYLHVLASDPFNQFSRNLV